VFLRFFAPPLIYFVISPSALKSHVWFMISVLPLELLLGRYPDVLPESNDSYLPLFRFPHFPETSFFPPFVPVFYASYISHTARPFANALTPPILSQGVPVVMTRVPRALGQFPDYTFLLWCPVIYQWSPHTCSLFFFRPFYLSAPLAAPHFLMFRRHLRIKHRIICFSPKND